ncbi:MAG: hypothetical protein ABWW66_03100 [Archaeoglobaceae archaeon]
MTRKIVRKWRLIKLSRVQSEFLLEFFKECVERLEDARDVAKEVAYRIGYQMGEEIASIKIENIDEALELVAMLSGVRSSAGSVECCPLVVFADVRDADICKHFFEGFFAALGFEVEVDAVCGEAVSIRDRRGELQRPSRPRRG